MLRTCANLYCRENSYLGGNLMSGNSRGFLGKLDFGLLISVFILLIFGIIGIASATHFQFSGTEEQTWYVYRQGLFILCSLLFLWFSYAFLEFHFYLFCFAARSYVLYASS